MQTSIVKTEYQTHIPIVRIRTAVKDFGGRTDDGARFIIGQ